MLQAAHDAGRTVPAIENRPTGLGYLWIWTGFIDLGTCRTYGTIPGPIPWTAIQKYVEVYGFSDLEAYIFHSVVSHLDNLWLELTLCRLKSKESKKRGPK